MKLDSQVCASNSFLPLMLSLGPLSSAMMGSSSGVPVEIPHWMVFEFRGGMIVRIETILDRADALEAAGVRE